MFYRAKLFLSEISQSTSVSRNTIKKWLRSPGDIEPKLSAHLANCAFTETTQNVVLVGGAGTGKTHLATPLGVAGVSQHGERARFYSTVDLVNALEQEKERPANRGCWHMA